VTDPEAAAHGGVRLLDVEVSLMDTLECGDVVVVAADHVCRSTKKLEIGRRKRSDLICHGERLVRAQPSPACERIAPPLEFAVPLSHMGPPPTRLRVAGEQRVNPNHRACAAAAGAASVNVIKPDARAHAGQSRAPDDCRSVLAEGDQIAESVASERLGGGQDCWRG